MISRAVSRAWVICIGWYCSHACAVKFSLAARRILFHLTRFELLFSGPFTIMEDLHRVTVLAQCDEEPVRHDLGCHWEVRTVAVYPSSVICKAVSCILSGGPIPSVPKRSEATL